MKGTDMRNRMQALSERVGHALEIPSAPLLNARHSNSALRTEGQEICHDFQHMRGWHRRGVWGRMRWDVMRWAMGQMRWDWMSEESETWERTIWHEELGTECIVLFLSSHLLSFPSQSGLICVTYSLLFHHLLLSPFSLSCVSLCVTEMWTQFVFMRMRSWIHTRGTIWALSTRIVLLIKMLSMPSKYDRSVLSGFIKCW